MKYEAIINHVIAAKGLSFQSVASKSHRPELCETRYMIWKLGKKYTKLSLWKLGEPFRRDHSTVYTGIKRLGNFISTEARVRDEMQSYFDYFDLFKSMPPERGYMPGRMFWRRKKLDKGFVFNGLKAHENEISNRNT